MILTIDLPRAAKVRLEEESMRTGIPICELAARFLIDHLKLDASVVEGRAPRPGYAADLFQGIDVDALLATPIPGIEKYMPQ